MMNRRLEQLILLIDQRTSEFQKSINEARKSHLEARRVFDTVDMMVTKTILITSAIERNLN